MMRRFTSAVLLAAGCASERAPAPEAAVDAFFRAFQGAMESAYLSARFETRLERPEGGPVEVRGTSRWYRGGVLLVEAERSGGGWLRILRAGDRAWVHRPPAPGWVAAAETSWPDAGQGAENPFELVVALGGQAELGMPSSLRRMGETDCWEFPLVEFEGCPVAALLSHDDAAAMARSRATGRALVWIDPTAVLRKIELEGEAGLERGGDRRIHFRTVVEMDPPGAPPPMRFDEIPAPVTPEMRAAVQKAQGSKP